jgi:hypothetical protein
MTKNCYNVTVPTVDNTTSVCDECGYVDWNCVSTEANEYLATIDGESLESAFTKLVAILVAKSAAISAINTREASYLTLTGTQTATNKTLTSPTINTPILTTGGTYANNAAAIVGGLTAGQLYQTATGVLMIVY